jgi:hypothetical protein
MAWAAIIPVALAALQEVTKQPPQGQTSKGQQGGGYTPTAAQFSAPGGGVGMDYSTAKLGDLYKQPGPEATQSVSDPGAGLGDIGQKPADQINTAQTADAIGGSTANGGQPTSNVGQYAQLAGSLAQMLQGQGAPGGGLMKGPSSAYQPTAFQQMGQRFSQLRANPYGGY